MKDTVDVVVDEEEEEEEEEEEQEERKGAETEDSPPQQEEEEDVCPVCVDALQKIKTKFYRYTCCGKGIHRWCDAGIEASSLSDEQKSRCPLCRTEYSKSDEETVQRLHPWVEKGKAWAQSWLGERYRDGLGVEQSYQRGKELFELSASQGEASAQYSLGLMYEKGQGVDQNYERAKEYYEAAARQGTAGAQLNLGCLYANGHKVSSDPLKQHVRG